MCCCLQNKSSSHHESACKSVAQMDETEIRTPQLNWNWISQLHSHKLIWKWMSQLLSHPAFRQLGHWQNLKHLSTYHTLLSSCLLLFSNGLSLLFKSFCSCRQTTNWECCADSSKNKSKGMSWKCKGILCAKAKPEKSRLVNWSAQIFSSRGRQRNRRRFETFSKVWANCIWIPSKGHFDVEPFLVTASLDLLSVPPTKLTAKSPGACWLVCSKATSAAYEANSSAAVDAQAVDPSSLNSSGMSTLRISRQNHRHSCLGFAGWVSQPAKTIQWASHLASVLKYSGKRLHFSSHLIMNSALLSSFQIKYKVILTSMGVCETVLLLTTEDQAYKGAKNCLSQRSTWATKGRRPKNSLISRPELIQLFFSNLSIHSVTHRPLRSDIPARPCR